VQGGDGETTLLPTSARRLPFGKLVLYGLGDSEFFDEGRYRAALAGLREVVGRLGVHRWALALPGRATGLIIARRALELFLDERRAPAADDVWLIEPQAAQKEMAEALGKSRR
jgi:hypothetical protein